MNQQNALQQTLTANYYTDPRLFERERALIFKQAWWLLCPVSELSRRGDYVCDTLCGWSVVAVRGDDEALYAFHNVCRHRAAPLFSNGTGRCQKIVCPYHGWVYDKNGQLQLAPGFGGDRSLKGAGLDLFSVAISEWNGLAFVNLSRDPQPLCDWLGSTVSLCEAFPSTQELEFYDSFEVSGRTNWKAYCDNTVEGYHLPFIHPRLGKSLARGDVDIKSYDDGHTVAFHVSYGSASDGAQLRGRDGLWMYKFPGFQLVAGANGFKAERIEAQAVDRLRSKNWSWYRDLNDDERHDAFAWARQVVEEDLGVCEGVFNNLSTNVYDSGPLSPQQETHVLRLQAIVREALK